ncbi:TRAP transporter small permease [Halomonas sp. I1]|uniref:TRAP transporter small permease n=1 Tax=Halomonas sp. I1 TaxID=393536 RepID=UPI0028DFA7F4|nr:TRAP transporter small permease [Halomonas sp. I1]MDT8893799.1 TRAP transporter small permease [Halomonas sp. I1]
MLALLERLERGIDAVTRPVVFVGMAAMVGVITLQIVSRVFFTSLGWTEEVARFLLVWITFLAATLAYRGGRHIAVDFVVEALPDRPQRLMRLLAGATALAFLVALMLIGYRYMHMQSFQKSASLRLSMTWIYAVIPLSAALMSWTTLLDILSLLFRGQGRATGEARE